MFRGALLIAAEEDKRLGLPARISNNEINDAEKLSTCAADILAGWSKVWLHQNSDAYEARAWQVSLKVLGFYYSYCLFRIQLWICR